MMEGDTTMAARIDRKTSIEFEPRTLRMEQIQFARVCAYAAQFISPRGLRGLRRFCLQTILCLKWLWD